MKKILLINPPVYSTKGVVDITPYPPLGLAYLSAALRNAGFETEILDCFLEGKDIISSWEFFEMKMLFDDVLKIGLTSESIVEKIEEYKPDIIAITHMFSRQRNIVEELLLTIKMLFPRIITIIGGAHVTATKDSYDKTVNYIVIGEGERAIIEIASGKHGRYNQDIVQCDLIEDLNSIAYPDWGTANLEKYFGSKMSHGYRKYERFVPVQTSRGCPANCIFCTAHKTWGKKYRMRSPLNVIKELEYLKEEYDIEEIMFEDDNLTLNSKRALIIFNDMIKLDLAWDTPNGIAVWTLSEKLIDKMVESGCYNINFAFESGSQRVLDEVIKKPVKLKRAKELVRYAKSTGIGVGLFLVVGVPGETKKEIFQTLKLAEELKIYFPHISIATAYPGSELYDQCIEAGILREDYDYRDMHIRKASISTSEWTANKLEKILRSNRKKRIVKAFVNEPIKTLKRVRRKICK